QSSRTPSAPSTTTCATCSVAARVRTSRATCTGRRRGTVAWPTPSLRGSSRREPEPVRDRGAARRMAAPLGAAVLIAVVLLLLAASRRLEGAAGLRDPLRALGRDGPGVGGERFIPMGTWFILVGAIGLAEWRPGPLPAAALLLSFVTLAYDPRAV